MTSDFAIRQLARQLNKLSRETRAQARASQAAYRSVESSGTPVSYYDADGVERLQAGVQDDGTFTITNVNSATPPTPTDPDVVAVEGGITISWDGTFVDDNRPADLSHVEVHVSDVLGFAPVDATQVTSWVSVSGGIYFFASSDTVTPLYAALVAVNAEGLESAKSIEVTATPLGFPTAPTDLLPPGSSPIPSLLGFPKNIIARWDGVVNNDPVTYDVYVTTNDAIAPAIGTLQQSTTDTAIIIGTDAAGTILQYATTYFVAVWARDGDGPAAAPSVWVPVQLNPNAAEDIAIGAIKAGHLESVMILVSQIRSSETGAGWTGDNTGIHVLKSDGSPRAALPTDEGLPVYIDGTADLDQVNIRDNLSLNGVNNALLPGASLQLKGSVPNPPALQASVSWPSVNTWYDPGEGFSAGGYGLAWNSTDSAYASANSFFGTQLMLFAEGGGFLGNVSLPEAAGYDNAFPYGGVTYLAGSYYTLCRCTRNSDGASSWQIRRYTVAAGVATLVGTLVINTGANFNGGDAQDPCIGHDGTNLQVVYYNGGLLKRRAYSTPPITFISEVNLGSPPGGTARSLAAIMIGTFDYGTTRTLVAHRGTDNTFFAYNGTVRSANDDFPVPSSVGSLTGAAYNAVGDATFRSFDGSGRLWTHYKNMWTTESSKWWPKFIWVDSDVTNGQHYTGLSLQTSVTMPKRAKLTLTCPTIPDNGGTDDPDSAMFYLGRAASEPAYTSMFLNASPGVGVRTVVITNALFSGSTHPTANVNNFPAAAASNIKDNNGAVVIDSNGLVFGAWRTSTAQNATDSAFTARTGWVADVTPVGVTYSSGVFTVLVAGNYMMAGQLALAVNTTGRRLLRIIVNGTTVAGQIETNPSNAAGNNVGMGVMAMAHLSAGDTVSLQAYQSTGAALAFGVNSDTNHFYISRLLG